MFLFRVILHVAGTDIENVMNSTYEKNNFIFNNPPFKKPSLLFCSKGDIYSDLDGVLSAFENWKSIGMQVRIVFHMVIFLNNN